MTRDENTYGFRRDDAEELVRGIGGGDREFPEVRARQRFRSEMAVALTDGSGITARSGTTPGTGNATIQFLESGDLTAHGSAITVRNASDESVGASSYLLAARDRRGTWWAVQGGGGGGDGAELFIFELTSGWTANEADADIFDMAETDLSLNVKVRDPLAVFAELVSGDKGYCLKQGTAYYAIQAPCPAEEE